MISPDNEVKIGVVEGTLFRDSTIWHEGDSINDTNYSMGFLVNDAGMVMMVEEDNVINLIGGSRELSDATPEATMRREMVEELGEGTTVSDLRRIGTLTAVSSRRGESLKAAVFTGRVKLPDELDGKVTGMLAKEMSEVIVMNGGSKSVKEMGMGLLGTIGQLDMRSPLGFAGNFTQMTVRREGDGFVALLEVMA